MTHYVTHINGHTVTVTGPAPESVLGQIRLAGAQEAIDRLIFGGQPAAAAILRHHFGLGYQPTVNEGSEP
jgi:hypothetical protein